MAALSEIERYASGGLFLLALAEAQRHTAGIYTFASEDEMLREDEADRLWCSVKLGISSHILRYLKLGDHEQEALVRTAEAPGRKTHVQSFLQILVTESRDKEEIDEAMQQEVALERAVAAMVKAEEETQETQRRLLARKREQADAAAAASSSGSPKKGSSSSSSPSSASRRFKGMLGLGGSSSGRGAAAGGGAASKSGRRSESPEIAGAAGRAGSAGRGGEGDAPASPAGGLADELAKSGLDPHQLPARPSMTWAKRKPPASEPGDVAGSHWSRGTSQSTHPPGEEDSHAGPSASASRDGREGGGEGVGETQGAGDPLLQMGRQAHEEGLGGHGDGEPSSDGAAEGQQTKVLLAADDAGAHLEAHEEGWAAQELKQGGEEKGKEEKEKEERERLAEAREGSRVAQAAGEALSVHVKVAVLWELLSACVADLPEEREGKAPLRAGYDARQRAALRLLATWMDVAWSNVAAMEVMVAYAAFEAQKQREAASKEAGGDKKASSWQSWKRGALIGAAAVTVGGVLAVTGGLAAPAIAAGLAAAGPAVGTVLPIGGAITLFATAAGTAAGSAAVIGAFGAAGAGLGGYKMARRTGGIEEFEFVPVGENHQQGRLAVAIAVSGMVRDARDYVWPWEGPDADLERYALQWESQHIIPLSTAVEDMIKNSAVQTAVQQGAMLTVLHGLVASLAWPITLINATNMIDSRWSMACDRADKAGVLLAEVLLKRTHGDRPVTLMGYSMGARLIFACLEHLASLDDAGGIVERVVLLGAPLPARDARWAAVRKVVAGRFVVGFTTSDWTLGLVYRSSFLVSGVAGIQKVETSGIENIDLTAIVKGHNAYRPNLEEVLQLVNLDGYYSTQ